MNHSNRLDKHENLIAALLRRIDKLEQKQHNDYRKNKGRIYKVLNYNATMAPASEVTPTAPPSKLVTPDQLKVQVDEDILVEAVKELEIKVPSVVAVKDEHLEHLQRVGLIPFRY